MHIAWSQGHPSLPRFDKAEEDESDGKRTDERKVQPRVQPIRQRKPQLEVLRVVDHPALKLESSFRGFDTVETDGVEVEVVAVGEDCRGRRRLSMRAGMRHGEGRRERAR